MATRLLLQLFLLLLPLLLLLLLLLVVALQKESVMCALEATKGAAETVSVKKLNATFVPVIVCNFTSKN